MAKKNEHDLSALLNSVAAALEDTFEKAEARLAKADGEGSPEGTPAGEETPGEATAGGPPADGGGDDAGGPPADDAGGPPADAGAGGPPPGGDPAAGGDAGGPADWASIFAAMPLDQLQQAYMALKQAMMEKASDPAAAGAGGPPMGGDPAAAGGPPMGAGGPPPGGDPAAAGGPPMGGDPAAAGGPPPEALKSEAKSQFAVLKKSHDTLQAELASQKQQNEQLLIKMAKVIEGLSRPQRKAVTSVAFLGKNEAAAGTPLKKSVATMPRAEIINQLNVLVGRSDLTKAERDAITSYTLGTVPAAAIEDLLNKDWK